MVLLLVGLVVLSFRRIDVRIDRRGLRVTYAGRIRFRHVLSRDEIESASVVEDPIALALTDGTTRIVTIDRPEGAVAALEA